MGTLNVLRWGSLNGGKEVSLDAALPAQLLVLTLFLGPVVATKGQSCTKHCTKRGQRPPGGFVGLVNTVKTWSRQQRGGEATHVEAIHSIEAIFRW